MTTGALMVRKWAPLSAQRNSRAFCCGRCFLSTSGPKRSSVNFHLAIAGNRKIEARLIFALPSAPSGMKKLPSRH